MYVRHTSHPALDNVIFARKDIDNGSVDPVISNHIFDCKKKSSKKGRGQNNKYNLA